MLSNFYFNVNMTVFLFNALISSLYGGPCVDCHRATLILNFKLMGMLAILQDICLDVCSSI